MSAERSIPVSEADLIHFKNEDEIVTYVLARILANKNRWRGTEWEFFFVKSDLPESAPITEIDNVHTFPITREDGQRAYREFATAFANMGYDLKYVYKTRTQKIVGLDILGFGRLSQEIGGQLEYSCEVCTHSSKQIGALNKVFHSITKEVAKRMGYRLVCKGHLKGHTHGEASYRFRQQNWHDLWNDIKVVLRQDSDDLREALTATASTQVTLDAGADKFHEFYKALLLLEPSLSLHYSDSHRLHVWTEAFENHLSGQVKPISAVWAARNAKDAVVAIVHAIMEVEIPFAPSDHDPTFYVATPFIGGANGIKRLTKIKDLLQQGELTGKFLNDLGSLVHTRPALRKFFNGLLEMRGVDCLETPEAVEEFVERVTSIIYNDEKRTQLLIRYEELSPQHIERLHAISAKENREAALKTDISDMGIEGITTMRDFVRDIVSCSNQSLGNCSTYVIDADDDFSIVDAA